MLARLIALIRALIARLRGSGGRLSKTAARELARQYRLLLRFLKTRLPEMRRAIRDLMDDIRRMEPGPARDRALQRLRELWEEYRAVQREIAEMEAKIRELMGIILGT